MENETGRLLSTAERWVRYEACVAAFRTAAYALASADLPVVPVKGIALARWLYDDVTERTFADVDMLVPRSAWVDARRVLLTLGEPLYHSAELGELAVRVGGVMVELHAEFGRLEITDLSVSDVVARSSVDTSTFGFPVYRLDEIDHLLLVAVNAIKDGFVFARPHISMDLERFLARTAGRRSELLTRASAIGFGTGLYCTADWMAVDHHSAPWGNLLSLLDPPPRAMLPLVFRAFRRTRHARWAQAVALGCWTNDRLPQRLRAIGRILRRSAVKAVGATAP